MVNKDNKIKRLSPTLRLKKRFLKVKIISKKKFDFKELSEELPKKLIYYVGVFEYSKAGTWLLRERFDFKNQTLVIKVSTKLKDKIIAALDLIENVNREKIEFKVTRVSGTLKGLEKN